MQLYANLAACIPTLPAINELLVVKTNKGTGRSHRNHSGLGHEE
jgi:hypothetical protein